MIRYLRPLCCVLPVSIFQTIFKNYGFLGKKFLRVTTTQKTSLFQRLIPEFQGNFSALWWRNPFRETLLFLGATTIWDLGHSALNNTTFACVALPFLGFLLCLILVVITKVLFNNYCVPVKCQMSK